MTGPRRYGATSPEAWKNEGACRTMDTDLFFPERGRAGPLTAALKAVCASCPVRVQCLDYALVNVIQHGIWGGKSERERRRLRAQRRAA